MSIAGWHTWDPENCDDCMNTPLDEMAHEMRHSDWVDGRLVAIP